MEKNTFLKERLTVENYEKLVDLKNDKILEFLSRYIEICNPKTVFVRTDSPRDVEYIRNKALFLAEEDALFLPNQTIHFDAPNDQARDKKNTRYFINEANKNRHFINKISREDGEAEMEKAFRDIMKEKEMYISFFSLGPVDSEFSILALQITDSAYVCHSEDLLYRPGYESFKKNPKADFFRFIHSAGELVNNVSKNIDKRRIYIDLDEDLVYSVNTQYAGNTVGLKKLALRLAIQKAISEDWLAEHMFVMGVKNEKDEKAYFCGAFPSMCGKTSTAMLQGETIVGDDIAYLRKRNGEVYAANVERGIFGIIKDVNAKDDELLFKALTQDNEIIFSNILVDEKNVPYWIGKQPDLPHKGRNFFGEWMPGTTDNEGNEILLSHKNARYTIKLDILDNVDDKLEDKNGVKVSGIIYGGRDSSISVPVEEALSWEQGVVLKGAGIESETTAATLGQEGVRVFNPMSNMDFLSVPLSKYISKHLSFSDGIDNMPIIFSVNYFLKDKRGKFLNDIEDKRVWLKWMRARVDGSVDAVITPTGKMPVYEDLKKLFKKVLNKDYMKEDYEKQFSVRVQENLDKIERIANIYNELQGIPKELFDLLNEQKARLIECKNNYGETVSPFKFYRER